MAQLVTEGLPDQVATSLAAFIPGALKIDVVTGGEASAELTLTGIATGDTIVGAVYVALESEKVKGIEAVTVTIVKADKVKTTTKTAGGKILVFWQDKSNG